MIRATDIHSLSDFQSNAPTYVRQITSTKNPIALTVDGETEVVVQDAVSYQSMVDRLEQGELIVSLRRAMDEMDRGQDVTLDDFKVELNQRHGA